jgi:hypothetical protein
VGADARGQRAAEGLPPARRELRGQRVGRCRLREREELPAVAHDVDVGQVLHGPRERRADLLGARGVARHQAAPQHAAGGDLGVEHRRVHENGSRIGPSRSTPTARAPCRRPRAGTRRTRAA